MGKHFFIYCAVIVGSLAISLDFASVDLILPALEQQFALDLESVQWVINGYILAFAVLMVTGGRLADAYGRKKIFILGMSIFALASLLGGAGWSGGSVIAFRVLQGVGAALLWPAMIGMACVAVGDAHRAMALGLIFGTCSLGNAAGPVVGGALTEWFSWRWVLWINVPMALLTILIALTKVPKELVAGEKPRNDFPGMVALTGGLVALMLFVYQVQPWGWTDPRTLALAVIAFGLLGAFPFIEKYAMEPLVPPDLMRNRELLTLCFCVMVICQLFFVVLLYFTQYAMKFMGDSPIAAGGKVVPFMLSYGVISYFGEPLSKYFGIRRLLLIGLTSATLAAALLGIMGPGAAWLPYNVLLVLLGVGVGSVIPTVSSRAIETAGTARAGLISGITFMCQLAGSALLLAVNTAIFTAVCSASLSKLFSRAGVTLTTDQNASFANVMAGAKGVGALPDLGPDTAAIAAQAYGEGLQAILWLGTVLVIVALVLVLRHVPGRHPVMAEGG